MVNLILIVVTYLFVRDYKDAEQRAENATREGGEYSTALDQQLAFEQEIKDLWGASNAESLAEEINNDLTTLGQDQAANTVSATLSQMRTEINNLKDQVQTLNTGLSTNRDRLVAAEQNAQNRVDQFQASQQDSEQQLQQLITVKEEEIAERDAEIQRWRNDYRALQTQNQELADEFQRAQDKWEQDENLLVQQITFLNNQLEDLQKVSFDRPDGRIVNVDNNTGTVWIDLGYLDNLRPQVTFSVYTKDHRGVGRGVEDIKAKIEVTRLLRPHMAEARILEEDLTRPIGENDPIYSPLWAAGRTEYFAFVGRMDIDDDGDSDYEHLFEIVRNAGGQVDLYVDDEGLRLPADATLSPRTKFLVIGDLDDPSEFSGQPEKLELAERIQSELKELENEALLYGIRKVGINDFLDYIGFRPQQRLWQPGEDRPFNLRNGARSASVNEALEDRISSGTVSELFRENRQRSSSDDSAGTTSGLFRN
jgi:hypothetical protein